MTRLLSNRALCGGALTCLLALLVACGPPGGGPAPSAPIAKLDGGKVRLSEHVGRDAVILVFWHTECDPCLQQMPIFVELDRRYRDRGLRVFAVNIDGPESRSQVGARAQTHGILPLPVLLDESTVLVNRYNPKVELPFTLFIGRSGKVTKRVAGQYMAGNADGVAPLVEQMLAEPPAGEVAAP